MLKVPSPLTEAEEALVEATIGCCIAVHRALGPGLSENIYSREIALELKAASIAFEREKPYQVLYHDELLCEQYLDFGVADVLVLEIKSVEHFAPIHHSQLLSYMRLSNSASDC
jgi:GxxExxY protein